jgi:hypothetical protein
MKSILAVLALCAPMFSCAPQTAYADETSDIKQCADNGALIQQYLLEQSYNTRTVPQSAGDLILMLTQDRVTIGASSGDRALDYWAIHQGIMAVKRFPLPPKCTAIIPMSYVPQEAV